MQPGAGWISALPLGSGLPAAAQLAPAEAWPPVTVAPAPAGSCGGGNLPACRHCSCSCSPTFDPLSMCPVCSYTGSQFNRVIRGQYVAAGQQGSHRSGYVEPPAGLPSNTDLVSSAAFK